MKRFSITQSKLSAVALFGVAMALTAGCGRLVNRTVERRIREALPRTIGPAREYRVHVASAMGRTLRGQLGDVVVQGDDVTLASGLVIESLNLDMRDVDVDVKQHRLRDIRQSTFRIVIRDGAIDRFLVGKSIRGVAIQNAHVTFGDGNRLTVTADRLVNGETIPITASGSLKIRDPQHAGVDLNRVSIVDAPVEGPELEFLQSKLEKAIDLSKLPINISLTNISTTQGTLILQGSADLTALAQSQAERAP